MEDDQIATIVDGVWVAAIAENVVEYARRTWTDKVFINFLQEIPLLETIINDVIDVVVRPT